MLCVKGLQQQQQQQQQAALLRQQKIQQLQKQAQVQQNQQLRRPGTPPIPQVFALTLDDCNLSGSITSPSVHTQTGLD